MAAELPTIPFATPAAWETWLTLHHADSPGLWLQMAKKETKIPSITYAEALDIALCFGWIDGQKNKLDEHYWIQKFTPRRPKSVWSQINRTKIEVLTAAGKMRPAGILQVERAKADGRWDAAYAGQATATIPEDLQAALDVNPAANEMFQKLSRVNRYAILYRVQSVKRAETRVRKIAEYIEKLARGETPHPN